VRGEAEPAKTLLFWLLRPVQAPARGLLQCPFIAIFFGPYCCRVNIPRSERYSAVRAAAAAGALRPAAKQCWFTCSLPIRSRFISIFSSLAHIRIGYANANGSDCRAEARISLARSAAVRLADVDQERLPEARQEVASGPLPRWNPDADRGDSDDEADQRGILGNQERTLAILRRSLSACFREEQARDTSFLGRAISYNPATPKNGLARVLGSLRLRLCARGIAGFSRPAVSLRPTFQFCPGCRGDHVRLRTRRSAIRGQVLAHAIETLVDVVVTRSVPRPNACAETYETGLSWLTISASQSSRSRRCSCDISVKARPMPKSAWQ